MPPRTRITNDRILQAGLEIVRTEGAENLNVRRVAAKLGCSTQPVMYQFKTIADLRAAIYDTADRLHTAYILEPDPDAENPLISIGLRYIRFAAEEPHLFRFLFQSNSFQNVSFRDLMQSDALSPVIAPLCAAAALSAAQAREVFEVLFISVHGAASLIADNSIHYDPDHLKKMLCTVFCGAVAAQKGEQS